jgi:hypothetical protein
VLRDDGNEPIRRRPVCNNRSFGPVTGRGSLNSQNADPMPAAVFSLVTLWCGSCNKC